MGSHTHKFLDEHHLVLACCNSLAYCICIDNYRSAFAQYWVLVWGSPNTDYGFIYRIHIVVFGAAQLEICCSYWEMEFSNYVIIGYYPVQ